MADVFGPDPDKMKNGDSFFVHEIDGTMRLHKAEAVVVHLPLNVAYVLRVKAAVLDETLEGMILQILEGIADGLKDGGVIGDELEAAYKQRFGETQKE